MGRKGGLTGLWCCAASLALCSHSMVRMSGVHRGRLAAKQGSIGGERVASITESRGRKEHGGNAVANIS